MAEQERAAPPQVFPAQVEVRLGDGRKLYGSVSSVDYEAQCFYLLSQGTVGMFGKVGDGTRILWDDCIGVFPADKRVGVYDGEDMVQQFKRFARTLDH